ncbi:MAG: 5-formyltetrahydrofolate cyclo-ligase [Candidatus Accumulibacter sp.]|jgi:5,10-methenyltetrahydrofolate synthetase|nr:5-formyltetrahydrofolate cyclo-ligase [Accumulibacter sp.]
MQTGSTPERRGGAENDASGRDARRRELRRAALARRKALAPDEYARRSQAVCGHLQTHFPRLAAWRVGFCWPMNNEPDVRPALEAWRAAGHASFAALLPVVVEAGAALAFRAWRPGMAMTPDRHGIPAPADGDFLRPQALLIPLAAFDAAGFRLGYGGGYFDRTLAGLRPRPLAIGVGFDLCRVESIFPEPHDERLDAVVTETGVVAFGKTRGQRARQAIGIG